MRNVLILLRACGRVETIKYDQGKLHEVAGGVLTFVGAIPELSIVAVASRDVQSDEYVPFNAACRLLESYIDSNTRGDVILAMSDDSGMAGDVDVPKFLDLVKDVRFESCCLSQENRPKPGVGVMEIDLRAMERVRFGEASGEPPAKPNGFGPGEYTLPEHTEKQLARLHPYNQDNAIEFHAKPHVYVVRLQQSGTRHSQIAIEASATSLIQPYAQQFNAMDAIAKMQNSRSEAWPKLKYAVGAYALPRAEPLSGKVLAVLGGKTVFAGEVQESDAMNIIERESRFRLRGRSLCDAQFYGFERAMTDVEILDLWDDNRERAANAGTEAHYQMELFANSLPCRLEDPEVQSGIRFLVRYLAPIGFKVLRTEWEVFSHEEEIAGSIDLVGTAPDPRFAERLAVYSTHGKYPLLSGYELRDLCLAWQRRRAGEDAQLSEQAEHVLEVADPKSLAELDELSKLRAVVVDWKRATDHDIHSPYKRMLKPPFEHIDDTAVAKFAMQLSVYKYMLEKRLGLKVMALCLAGLHPESPFHTFVPYMRDEIEYIMSMRRARVESKVAVRASAAEGPRCAHSGDYAWIAVRGPDGALYHEPYAKLCFPGSKLEIDADAQQRIDALMQRCGVAQPVPVNSPVRWVRRIPPSGYPEFVRCDDVADLRKRPASP